MDASYLTRLRKSGILAGQSGRLPTYEEIEEARLGRQVILYRGVPVRGCCGSGSLPLAVDVRYGTRAIRSYRSDYTGCYGGEGIDYITEIVVLRPSYVVIDNGPPIYFTNIYKSQQYVQSSLKIYSDSIIRIGFGNDIRLVDMKLFSEGMSLCHTFSCRDSSLESLDLSPLTDQCTIININNNLLQTIDFGTLSNIQDLDIFSNPLSTLNIINTSKLIYFNYGNTDISFNVATVPQLLGLNIENMGITRLDLSSNKNLISINACSNPLQSLYLDDNNNLERLYISDTSLNSIILDISSLQLLYCPNNNLSFFDISACTNLENLQCYDCSLNSLDVTKNANLTTLACYNNPIQTLDISACIMLETLYCNDCSINSLDVSACANLTYLSCNHNLLDQTEANALAAQLIIHGSKTDAFLEISEQRTGTLTVTGGIWDTLAALGWEIT